MNTVPNTTVLNTVQPFGSWTDKKRELYIHREARNFIDDVKADLYSEMMDIVLFSIHEPEYQGTALNNAIIRFLESYERDEFTYAQAALELNFEFHIARQYFPHGR